VNAHLEIPRDRPDGPRFGEVPLTLVSRDMALGTENVEVVLALPRLGSISGHVVGTGIRPDEVRVVLHELDDPTSGRGGGGTDDSYLASDGSFSFEGLPPGRYGIATGTDEAEGARVVVLTEGERAENVVIEIATNVLVTGQLVDPTGHGLGGLEVDVEREAVPHRRLDATLTDGSGRFAIELAPGPWRTSLSPDSLRIAAARLGTERAQLVEPTLVVTSEGPNTRTFIVAPVR
jgi:hypothetical protein